MDYSIGVIIQKNDNLPKVRSIINAIKGIVDIQPNANEGHTCTLKSNPNVQVGFWVGVAEDVSQQNKVLIGNIADNDNSDFIPNIHFVWFGGQTYTLDQMKVSIKVFMSFECNGYYMIIDSSSNLNNLTFTKY